MKVMLIFLLLLGLNVIDHKVNCDVQSFNVSPQDTEVVQGQNAVLHCHVSNLVGSVQWSKDGLLLGFDPSVPGFPRYSVEGDLTQGIYNLKIENAELEDEADFECQVGPSEGQQPISSKAHLTILLPPNSIRIVDHLNMSHIEVRQSESLSLTCEVKGGKPAAGIRWSRNSVRLPEDASEKSVENEGDGRQTAKSTLKLNPSPDDNKAYYGCEATGRTVTKRLRAGVFLNVLYPPGRPQIDGYRTSEKIRAGDTVNLRCLSRGGNPLAQLTWTKNGQFIDHSYVTSDWESVNEISFVAGSSDDAAVYSCTANTVVSPEPLSTSVTLSVLYSPSSVSVKAPAEAKSGDHFAVTCKTDKSNPAAEISWVVDGQPVISNNVVEAQEKGGWITSSEINVNVTQEDRNLKLLSCYAINQQLGETIVETATVTILYPPERPAIFGYIEGNPIRAATLQRLSCVSHGGNPLPELKWFKGNEELSSSQPSSTGNVVSVELTVVAAAADNGAEYLCKSTSKAIPEPLVATIKLTVYFPPSALSMKVKPKKPKAGAKANLICESSSSNPAAKVSWWKDGVQLPLTSNSTNSSSENGGITTKLVYSLNLTAGDDGSTYTCQATNEAVQQSVHDSIVLGVFYKPVFADSEPVFEVKQGEACIMNLTAKGNPDDITYLWTKGNETMWDTAFVNISDIERTHTGTYKCKATNEIGTSIATVSIKVLFPAVILKPEGDKEQQFIVAEPESDSRLECTADGYPLPDNVITWQRDSFDMQERTQSVSKGNGKSVLIVRNVSREASGEFTCVADNGIGTADKWKVTLLVKHKPVIVEPDKFNSVLSDRGVTVQLRCKAEGVPDVRFEWSFEGVKVSEGNSRMTNAVSRIDHVTWEGTLTIGDVVAKDFGDYKCIARNDVAFDTTQVTLKPDSAPDPPLAIKVTNATRHALFVTWAPGFDGGHNQSYRIRFKLKLDPTAYYYDVHPPTANSTWIVGLKPDSEYEFAAMAFNDKGSSLYTSDIVRAKTLASPGDRFKPEVDMDDELGVDGSLIKLLVSTISTVFVLLLIFNIVLLAVYYKKKTPSPKRKYSSEDWQSSSDVSSSNVESQETTFSSYSDAPGKDVSTYTASKDETSYFETESTPDFDTKSTDSYSITESESESYSPDIPVGVFV